MDRILLSTVCLAALLSTVAVARDDSAQAVSGTLEPLNRFAPNLTGRVTLTPEGDRLTMRLEAENVPPGMHLAHIHGFAKPEPADAVCPGKTADSNQDGYVDLIETRKQAGITMIPFTDAPTSLQIQSHSYPTATERGQLSYERTVRLADLRRAVEAKFGTPLALEKRVVFIHGAPEGIELPDSVQSLEGVPASVTIPIACAELNATE